MRNNYFANDASAVLRLDVDAVSQNLKVNGFYAENMLSGVKTVDEDGAVSIVYTDKEGHTVYQQRQLRAEGDVVDRIVFIPSSKNLRSSSSSMSNERLPTKTLLAFMFLSSFFPTVSTTMCLSKITYAL